MKNKSVYVAISAFALIGAAGFFFLLFGAYAQASDPYIQESAAPVPSSDPGSDSSQDGTFLVSSDPIPPSDPSLDADQDGTAAATAPSTPPSDPSSDDDQDGAATTTPADAATSSPPSNPSDDADQDGPSGLVSNPSSDQAQDTQGTASGGGTGSTVGTQFNFNTAGTATAGTPSAIVLSPVSVQPRSSPGGGGTAASGNAAGGTAAATSVPVLAEAAPLFDVSSAPVQPVASHAVAWGVQSLLILMLMVALLCYFAWMRKHQDLQQVP